MMMILQTVARLENIAEGTILGALQLFFVVGFLFWVSRILSSVIAFVYVVLLV